jgi:preprotein translocase subunit SecA
MNALVLDLQSFYPTEQTVDSLSVYTDAEEIGALVIDEAVGKYEKKAENFPGGLDTAKEIERDVMLQILDQRWRDHLSDMDYLRDGIHLRQTAQQDPLNAWQKEGYLMFEHLLDAVDIDYVRYITHVEATAAIEESTVDDGLEGALTNANEIAPGATELPAHVNAGPSTAPKAPATAAPHEKLGRNDPCWCGSKRKFKQCHGRP